MKKILLLICMHPLILLSAYDEIIHSRESEEESKVIEEKKPLQTRSLSAKKSTTIPQIETHQNIPIDETSKPTIPLDFKEFARQDSLRTRERQNEDAQRKARWQDADRKEKESRQEQSFFERTFNKLSGVHTTGEEEKNASRSKTIFETNKARMFEDFKRQSERFNDFTKAYPDFNTGDGATLLKLGRMDEFITMDKNSRETLLDEITEIVNDEDRLNKFSLEAMQDLVQLTNLSRGTELPEGIKNIITPEINNENEDTIRRKLIDFLKDSMTESLKAMKAYSDAIESNTIQNSIKDLASIRRVKNFANHGTMVLGSAGLLTMVIPGVSHIASAVHLTAERLFIGAKGLFLGAHASGGVEAHFERTLQDKYVDAFQNLLPKSTELLKTEIITTIEEKGYVQKAKDWFKDKTQKANTALENSKIGEHYKKVKAAMQSTSDSVSNSDVTKKVTSAVKSASDSISN